MNFLPTEIIQYSIFPILSDKTAISFFLVNKACYQKYYPIYSFKKWFSETELKFYKIKNVRKLILFTYNISLASYNITHLRIKAYSRSILSRIIFSNLIYLKLDNDFNSSIEENLLPKSLLSLIFGTKFNKKIKKNVLPPHLTCLEFGFRYNQEIEENVFPDSLLTLQFDSNFDQAIDFQLLPRSLKELKLFTFGFDIIINIDLLQITITEINTDEETVWNLQNDEWVSFKNMIKDKSLL